MFGAGLARPIDGIARAVIEGLGARVFPSQRSMCRAASTARPARSAALRRGRSHRHLLPQEARPSALSRARRFAARRVLAQIGIPDSVSSDIAPRCFENGPALWLEDYPWPRAEDHKYRRGHVVDRRRRRADRRGRLAARAAARAGAGLVTVAAPGRPGRSMPAPSWAIIVRPMRAPEEFARTDRRRARARHGGRARAPASRRRRAQRRWRRLARGAPSCSTPTRSPPSPQARDAVRCDQGTDGADAA